MQKASHIFMVRPVRFGYNEQTAESNSFQHSATESNSEAIQKQALEEFDTFVEKLKQNNIDVTVFEDTITPHTPDSIFPNNWISFHNNNSIVLYPMLAENRRLERRTDIIHQLKKENTSIIDLSIFENKNQFLEGTGSIVFDYENKIAYANISPRTDKNILDELCKKLNYTSITFKAVDITNKDIYHTNVLMCIGNRFAVICKDCITDKNDLQKVIDSLKNTQHEIIEIEYNQMNSFAGNMYQLFNKNAESCIVMSELAFKSLHSEQIKKLEQYGNLIHSPLYTIEKYGGGSARCMIADVRL
jgi:hypothetical protein